MTSFTTGEDFTPAGDFTYLTFFEDRISQDLMVQQLEHRRNQRDAVRARVQESPDLAINAIGIANMYPNMAPEVVTGAALAGIPYHDPRLQLVADRQLEQDAESMSAAKLILWPVDQTLRNVRGVVRGMFTAFDLLWEEGIARPLRTVVGTWQTGSLLDSYSKAGASIGTRAIDEFFGLGRDDLSLFEQLTVVPLSNAIDPFLPGEQSLNRVNLGTGFFANSDVATPTTPEVLMLQDQGMSEAEAMALTQAQMGTPITQEFKRESEQIQISRGGVSTPVSPGRLLAITVTQPGTIPFNLLSGGVDFAAQVLSDPADRLLFAAKGLSIASKAVRPDLATHAQLIARGFSPDEAAQHIARQTPKFVDAAPTGISPPSLAIRGILRLGDALVSEGRRRTILGRNVSEFLTDRSGEDFVEWIGQQNKVNGVDQGAHNTIARVLNGTQPMQVRGSLINELVDLDATNPLTQAQTHAQIRDVLRRAYDVGELRNSPVPTSLYQRTRDVAGLQPTPTLSGRIGSRIESSRLPFLPGKPVAVPTPPNLASFKVGVHHRIDGTTMGRWFSEMAGRHIDVFDPRQGYRDFQKYVNAMGFSADEASELMYRFAAVPEGNYEEYLDVVKDATKRWAKRIIDEDTGGVLEKRDYEPFIDAMTKIFDSQDQFRQYWIDHLGNHLIFPGARLDINAAGKRIAQPSPHLISQFLDRAIPLMDPRHMRKIMRNVNLGARFDRAGAPLPRFLPIEDWNNLADGALTNMADFYMQSLWKPMTLLRVAWPVRVIGEEQLRMAAGDLESLFHHPIQYLAWVIARDGKRGKSLREGIARGDLDVFGGPLNEAAAHKAAMSRAGGGLFNRRYTKPNNVWVAKRRHEPGYWHDWHQNFHQHVMDPISREVAAAYEDGRIIDLSEVKERFYGWTRGKDDLRKFRERLIADNHRWRQLGDRELADAYVDSVWLHMVMDTGGDGIYYIPDEGIWRRASTQEVVPIDEARQIVGYPGRSGPPGGARDLTADPFGRQLRDLEENVIALDRDAGSLLAHGMDPAEQDQLLDRISLIMDDMTEETVARSGFAIDVTTDEGANVLQDFREATEDLAAVIERDDWDNLGRAYDEWSTAARELYAPIFSEPQQYAGRLFETTPVSELRNVLRNEQQGGLSDLEMQAGLENYGAGQYAPMRPTPVDDPYFDLPLDTPDGIEMTVTPTTYDLSGNVFGAATAYNFHAVHNGQVYAFIRVRFDEYGRYAGTDMKASGVFRDDFPNLKAAVLARLGTKIEADDLLNASFQGLPVKEWLLRARTGRNVEDAFSVEELGRMSPREILDKVFEAVDPDSQNIYPIQLPEGSQITAMEDAGALVENLGVMLRSRVYSPEQAAVDVRDLPWEQWPRDMRVIAERTFNDIELARLMNLRRAGITDQRIVGELSQVTSRSPEEIQRLLDIATGVAERKLSVRGAENLAEMIRIGGVDPDPFATALMGAGAQRIMPTSPGEGLTFSGARNKVDTLRRFGLENPDTGRTPFTVAHTDPVTGDVMMEISPKRPTVVIDKAPNGDLIRAIANGKFEGDEIGKINLRDMKSRKELDSVVTHMHDNYTDVAPPLVRGIKRETAPSTSESWDQAIDWLFGLLMSRPTNYLSRSPAFKQYYWQKIAEMMPLADRPTRNKIIAAAREANIETKTFRQHVADAVRRAFGDGVEVDGTVESLNKLAGKGRRIKDVNMEVARPQFGDNLAQSMDDLDVIAKAFALEQTKQLLYDLQKRHDFWDMTRNIFPFGEAWSEIMTSWVRLMGQNPRVMRRAQQVIEGAREERQNFQVEGEHLPGFFYVDPVTNEEVFNYPGGGLLTNWMVGGGPFADSGPGSMQLTGRTQGLNLFAGNALPGVGPVIQIPASTMQPFANFLDNPDQKWLRELILPFGKTEGDNPVELIADSVLPAWMKKGMIAFWHGSGENERLYNNTVIDVYKAMVMGGAYSDATPEQAQAALAEAKKIARNIYIIRSLAQAVLPTGPSVRWDARDETGELWAFQTLATEYRKMQEENDYDEVATFNQFTEAFGLDPTLFVTPKTQSLVRRSTTEPGLEWEQRNPEVFDDFAFTAYYGRPDDPYEPFDYNAYINQLREKTRKGLTPEQWQLERNDTLGRIAYEHARRMVGPRTDPAAVAWLRGNRYAIMERYPGYNEPTVGVARTATRDQLIREFYLWETNETLAGTDAGQGVAEYLRARDQVILISTQEMGLTETGFRNAAKALQLRNWLRYQAAQIVMRHPDFGPVWDQVFSREIEEDALSPVQLTAEASGFLEPQGV